MDSANKEILKYVRKARDRMHMAFMLEFTAKALAAALGVYLAIALLARFLPIYAPYYKGAVMTGVIIITSFVISLFMPPKDKSAAILLDSKGLCERTLTAYELLLDNSPIVKLQRKDALEHLKKFNINNAIKIKFPKKPVLISGILALMILVSGFAPNSMEEKAGWIHEMKKEINRQQKEIDKAITKVENNSKLTLEQKKEAKEALSELKKDIGKAQDPKDKEKALQRTENKLGILKQKYTDKDLNDIVEAFAKNEATKGLAEALRKGNTEKLKNDIEKMTDVLKGLDEEQLKKLSESLSELGRNLSGNPELAEAFYELSQKMASGELGDIQSELNDLAEQIDRLMENDEFGRAMEEVLKELRNSAAQSKPGTQGSQGHGQGQGQGQGQQGTGQSQGQGQAGGSPGGGAGSGTGGDSDTESPQGSGTGIGNKQPSPADVREYEKVFSPSLVGGEGEKSQLQGAKNNDGQTREYIIDSGMVIRGEMQPYNQIIGEYKEKAFQDIEGRQIPQGMQDIVKDYFTSLED